MSEPPYGQEPQPQGPDRPEYPSPSSGQQPPPYGAPPPPYGTPYGTPPPPYGTPPGYGAGQPGYGGYGPPGYGVGRPLANWGQRVAAYLIDTLITAPFSIIAGIIFAVSSTPGTATVGTDGTTTDITVGSGPSAAVIVISVVLWLAAIGLQIYNRAFRQGRTGQSWGKQIVKLRLLSETTGQPIGAGMAFVRDLAHILDSLACYVGWLWPLWDDKRQTFADKLIKTVVTSEA